MNKIKYIPILALAALLSSCGVFGGKAPKFENEGEEINKYADFYNRYNDTLLDSEIMDSDVLFTDRLIKASVYENQITTVKRGNKELSKTETTSSSKSEGQYDADNYVAKITGEQKQSMKGNNQEGNGSYTTSAKMEYYYQFEKEGGTKYLVFANAKTQEYSHYEQVSSVRKQDALFDNLIRSEVSNLFYQFASYVEGASSNSKDYLFYIKDDSLFTLATTKENTVDAENYKMITKTKLKVQLNTEDKKQSFKVSSEINVEYRYTRDYMNYRKDDVKTVTTINYKDYSVTNKNTSLSAIDVGDYLLVY